MCDAGNLCILLGHTFYRVDQNYHNIRAVNRRHGTDDAVALQFFFDLALAAQPGCVDKYIFMAVPLHACIYRITRCAGNIGNNQAVFAKDAVNQR